MEGAQSPALAEQTDVILLLIGLRSEAPDVPSHDAAPAHNTNSEPGGPREADSDRSHAQAPFFLAPRPLAFRNVTSFAIPNF